MPAALSDGHQRETAVAVTPPAQAEGHRAPGSSQALRQGEQPWSHCGCTSAAGGSCTQQMQTHCFVPSSHRCTETWSWGLEVEESYCSEMKDKGQREDSSFSTARQATEFLPGPGDGTPPGLSSTSQNTALGISLLSQQIAFRRDSRKRHQWL